MIHSAKYRTLAVKLVIKTLIGMLLLCGLASPAYAYIGPGLGLGAIGVLLGVIGGILLAIFGLFWYPIKRMLKRRAGEPEIVLVSEEQTSIQDSESLADEKTQRQSQASSEPL